MHGYRITVTLIRSYHNMHSERRPLLDLTQVLLYSSNTHVCLTVITVRAHMIIFLPQIYVQHTPCSFGYSDSRSSVCVSVSDWIHKCFPCMYLLFVCMCLSIHECMWVMCHPPSIITKVKGTGIVQFKSQRVCGCGFCNVEGNVVFWLRRCSVFFVPLNKHMWLDESVSASCWSLLGDHGWWSITIHPLTTVPLHSTAPSSGTVDMCTYITCSASYITPHTNRHFTEDIHTDSSNQSWHTDGCSPVWGLRCSLQWDL